MTDPGDFDCKFRPADPSDYSQLHRLIRKCWVELYAPHIPKASVRRFLDSDSIGKHLEAFLPFSDVAVVDGVVVGVIGLFEQSITSLFVAKRCRGFQIGTCLLHNAELAGGRTLEVAAFNWRAIGFYAARGWRKVGECSEDVGGARVEAFRMERC
ncbi:GNAT family N-acetyltransferase [Rhizobium sp. GN54]|uniref:GNAT family N-acetyltransferase n=1 Tax=Rhizobium sp. GN54 TaxID=2898150 RepID=UPI001E46736D|nr:GNAT family N-acetyltransferase [Rhizobium sp. GN54]MCD2185204.1 GNAT family N-acetyltransferase [Rhizobium sp. GN54]